MTEFSLPPSFNQSCLVLIEGSDDEALVTAFVNSLRLPGFQYLNMKGKDDWPNKLRAIVADPTFRANVVALGLVRDADQNPAGTWQSCKSAIEGANMIAPSEPGLLGTGNPATCVAVLPHHNKEGAIEELCLESFPADMMQCVATYFACVDKGISQNHASKAYVQAYLAGLVPLKRNLQVAAAANALDFEHPAFNELRTFLENLHRIQGSPPSPQ